MKLLVISESPLEKIGDTYYAVDSWVQFPCRLSLACDRVTLLAPVVVREKISLPQSKSWRIELERLNIAHHDFYYSFASYWRLWPFRFAIWQRRISELAANHDAVVLRLPSPMISIASRAVRAQGKPLVVVVAGDVEAQSERIYNSRGLKRFFYTLLTRWLVRQEIGHSRQAAMVFAYSRFLIERHRGANRIEIMRTPHISLKDIIYRDDTCQSFEIRLLRVCWLLSSKGIEFLLDAVALLLKKGYRIKLDIAGHEKKESGYLHRLGQHASILGIVDHVRFLNWIPYDRLNEHYVASDIQVISSLSEGTPRCMIEGMARGLPLVSTAVGGCIDYLRDGENALLAPPARADALAEAIERIIRDGSLRRRMIQKGYETAKAASFENLGMHFIETIEDVVANFKGEG